MRLTAEFWGIRDPRLAFLVHSVVGGTPAYRKEFVNQDVPRNIDDFDDWVARTVLNPATPLSREARYLLIEETDIRDPTLYHAVLSAVVEGNGTRGSIASYLERPATDIGHPLTVLEDAGLLHRDVDVFRKNRTTYRIAEPLLAFYQAIMREVWDQVEKPRLGERIWRTRQRVFACNILGPHFEEICRTWTLSFANPELFHDELVARVGSGVVNDPKNRTTHEVDVAAIGVADNGKPPLLAIGEAQWNDLLGRAHLERLERIRHLIAHAGQYDATNARLLLFSGAGFNDRLRDEVAKRSDVSLVGLDELYGLGD